MSPQSSTLFVLAGAGPLLMAAAARAQASFTHIGDLPGGRVFSECYALSRDGRTAFGDSVTANFDPINSITSACSYSAAAGLVWLDPSYSSISTFIFGANRDGTAAAGMAVIIPPYADVEAFRWTASGGIQIIGDLPGGTTNAVARAISDDGSVLVGYGSSAASIASCGICLEAFKWTAATGLVALGDVPGGNLDSRASGISGDGRIIVGAGTSATGVVAVYWDQSGPHSMGYLPQGPSTPPQSQCFAANTDGSVIVGASSSSNGIYEAFRWTPSSGMQGLGDLPTGPFQSYAYGVSDDGAVVVGQGTVEGGLFGAGQGVAFIWDARNGMRAIVDVLTGLGVDMTGWSLTSARAISSDGTVISGIGLNPDGNGEGWIAVIPRECYANCDASTTPPILNIADFVCFQQRFAGGDSYANCDGSTAPPTLNIADFVCFMAQFAAGCG
jgi:probable HAF family extracellular repeat protein